MLLIPTSFFSYEVGVHICRKSMQIPGLVRMYVPTQSFLVLEITLEKFFWTELHYSVYACVCVCLFVLAVWPIVYIFIHTHPWIVNCKHGTTTSKHALPLCSSITEKLVAIRNYRTPGVMLSGISSVPTFSVQILPESTFPFIVSGSIN